MKYVIFKRKGLVIPLISTEQATHSQMKLEGFTPVSAGFCYINSQGALTVDHTIGSESLGLRTNLNDDRVLTFCLLDYPASFYLDSEHEHYPNVELSKNMIEISDVKQKRSYSNAVFEILKQSYDYLPGGFPLDLDQLIYEQGTVWRLYVSKDDTDKGSGLIQVIVYKPSEYGNKVIYMASTSNHFAKKGLSEILEVLLTDKNEYWWGEASGRLEDFLDKMKYDKISNEIISKVLSDKDLELCEDGFHYYRNIQGKRTKKLAFGNIKLNQNG